MKEKAFGWLHYVIKTNRLQVLIALLTVFLSFFLFFSFKGNGFENHWDKWLEPFLSISIIIITLSIWFNEQYEEWVKSLPKKLNITYLTKSEQNGSWEVFCKIINAPLSHEGDIRNWGQSIGQTILNKSVSIAFAGFKIEKSVVYKKEKKHQYFLTVYLQKEINGINKGDVMHFDNEGCFERKLIP
jgi:hypothetical protein